MSAKEIFVGEDKLKTSGGEISGEIIKKGDEEFYKISNYDKMEPFLVSLASSSDHWLFISSLGGLTAGRKNADNALFPYVTDDKLHDNSEFTGAKTIILLEGEKGAKLWEPFSNRFDGVYSVERNIYKNISSTKILFEEINNDLKLVFRYGWTTGDRYGFVKFSEIENISRVEQKVNILDGIENILPADVINALQSGYSTLVNGYKKNELIEESGIGVFSLSSIPSDRAQPSESLRATTVFSCGVDVKARLLSSTQLDKFRRGEDITEEKSVKGRKAAYFIQSEIQLEPSENKEWYIVSEINQNTGDVIDLNETVRGGSVFNEVKNDIEENRNNLIKLIAKADGLQLTSNKRIVARHFSNVLFNVMRGGVFEDSYSIEKKDLVQFLKKANPFVVEAHRDFIDSLPNKILHSDLLEMVVSLNDKHFYRLILEYLPLMFSRRHGDPSRPWNQFSIDIKDEKGERVLNYQGNWRDIFQNWEALSLSYPGYLKSMVAKFLNNTTADGYNPYRIFRDGFDWENVEPGSPWANIGYWGDHQVIYLLKLLEWLNEFDPAALHSLMNERIFSFANVPYRIKSYEDIVTNPRDTIEFDFELNEKLRADEKLYGSDAKYLKKADDTLLLVNMMDKLLITLLVKMTNFIPGGGIWLNTQRPEWNDANNALVGYGLSMVTTYYLRRYLNFLKNIISSLSNPEFEISDEIEELLKNVTAVLKKFNPHNGTTFTPALRKEMVDKLGKAGSVYRKKIYAEGFSGRRHLLGKSALIECIDICLEHIDATIKVNKREDGLYHSYNILKVSNDGMSVSHLYEMLEGQVAVLSSGYLSPKESVNLLEVLKKSSLYREDQNSYILYPDKELPLFIEKNNLEENSISSSQMLSKLIAMGNTDIIYRDVKGNYHFQSDLQNSEVLSNKLDSLSQDGELKELIESEKENVLELYEHTFDHKTFTGRANTFYKYEGLGSIYWHMVSKLLLAVGENYRRAETEGDTATASRLKEIYYDIRQGIGVEKTPEEYGAFTTDPYSHTPAFCGVQQPGMTGQVKEDIISRFNELGITINDAKIVINPSLFNPDEFTNEKGEFKYYDVEGELRRIELEKGSIAFTYCQVPFLFKLSENQKVNIHFNDNSSINVDGLELNEDISRSIFRREGKVKLVEVELKRVN